MKAESANISKRENRTKRIIYILLVLVAIGGSAAVYDFVGRKSSDDIFTEDPQMKREIVQKWLRVGFLIDIDVASSKCHFNDDRWKQYDEGEKIGITLMLGSYCADGNGTGKKWVTITGSISGNVLATLGESGVELR